MATSIHIREIRPSGREADEMDSIGLKAFTDFKVYFPKGQETRDQELRWRSQRFRDSLKNPSNRFVAAVEETVLDDGNLRNEVIGWARWVTPPAELEPEKSEEEKHSELEEKMKSFPDVMDKEAYRKVVQGSTELEKQWLAGDDPRNYWELDVIAVHPDHQRKGVGSKLTKWGVEKAAAQGKGVGLISRSDARPLYISVGFKTCGPVRYAGGDCYAMRLDRPARTAVGSSE